jgi:DNA repair protein RecN (Recombination protein N)
MLMSLRIDNFAIVEKLELDFQQGMTVFTGETGAGKSIMIDALMLALGGRTDASVIRNGADQCSINACFQVDLDSLPAKWLQEHDLAFNDGEILLRRVIFAEGRSKSYINGTPFPIQKIKELSEYLVEIHGQHQHQNLLKHATHREQLDRYANHRNLYNNVETLYFKIQTLKTKLNDFKKNTTNNEHMLLLRYQLDELEQLNLQEDELNTLHTEHQLLHHAREYLHNAQRVTTLLNADDAPNIRQYIYEILQIIHEMPENNPQICNLRELMENALIHCDEALDEIDTFATSVILDPERLQIIEERMSKIHQLARKYHIDASQLYAHQRTIQAQLEQNQHHKDLEKELNLEYQAILQQYQDAALQLRQSRQQHAPLLAKEIEDTIRQLGMPHSTITINFTPLSEPHEHGLDKIEYLVATNPGLLPDLLSKIASGGELSRISLGIHMITAQRGATPTLLFDEVDVGIGGKTASLVGQLLRQLGKRLQLFCVTHQPQVAACAEHHFLVEKQTQANQTFSSVNLLNSPARMQEIARMLGGLHITEQTLAHAQELIMESNCYKSCNNTVVLL